MLNCVNDRAYQAHNTAWTLQRVHRNLMRHINCVRCVDLQSENRLMVSRNRKDTFKMMSPTRIRPSRATAPFKVVNNFNPFKNSPICFNDDYPCRNVRNSYVRTRWMVFAAGDGKTLLLLLLIRTIYLREWINWPVRIDSSLAPHPPLPILVPHRQPVRCCWLFPSGIRWVHPKSVFWTPVFASHPLSIKIMTNHHQGFKKILKSYFSWKP